ncbi:MAG: EAL domain-containing protein [Eubacteriales bacterium]|nr:EAL domain-containing protein [Eubacteriales bacterium]
MGAFKKRIVAWMSTGRLSEQKQGGNRRLLLFFVLIFLGISILITAFLSSYRERLEVITEAEINEYLAEISSQTTVSMVAQYQRNEVIVREMGRATASRSYESMTPVLRYLEDRILGFGFGSAGLIDDTGLWHTPFGRRLYSTARSDVAKILENPNTEITAVREILGQPHLVIVVGLEPFTIENFEFHAIGVTIPVHQASEALQLSFFNGQGYANILTADGDNVYSSYAEASSGTFNMLEMLAQSGMKKEEIDQIRSNMKSGASGVFRFAHQGDESIVHYAPMNWQNWYLFIVAPSQVLSTKNAEMMSALLQAGIMSGIFWVTALVIILLYLIRKQLKIQMDAQADVQSLRAQEELYKLALAHSRRHVLQLDIKNRTLRAEDDDFFYAEPGTVWNNLPESLFARDMIAEDSKDQIRMLYRDILDGKESGETTIMARGKDGRAVPHRINYTTLFDEEGAPSCAIITYEDISAVRDKELAYKRWRETLDKIPVQKYRLIEHNLSQDVVDNAEGELFDAGHVKYVMHYNQKMEHFVRELVHPEDVRLFAPIMDREQLIQDYEKGKRSLEFEFRLLKKNSESSWVKLSMQLIAYPDTTDIKSYKMYEDIDAAKRMELAMKFGSEQDSLTKAYNRRTLEEKVSGILENSREDERHALILIDVDNLKQINDQYGHAAGDDTLVMITNILRSVFQQDDVIGRLGGDEFVVLMRNVPGDHLVSRRVQQVNATLRTAAKEGVFVSCSMGISQYPKDGSTFAQLYQRADQALYRAKGAGKNDFFFYSSYDTTAHFPEETLDDGLAGKEETFDRCYLFRSEDEWRYRSILESTRTIVIELDIDHHAYTYDVNVARFLAGTYDDRPLEQILTQDRVTDPSTIDRIQAMIRKISVGGNQQIISKDVLLRTKEGDKRWFRMRVIKMDDSNANIKKVLIVLNDSHEEILTMELLRRLADYDDLTDVYNKAAFIRLTEERVREAEPGAYALIGLDVDRFKNVNELFGFGGGNRLLRHIARILAEEAGEEGITARLTADHFVMLVPNDSQRIKKALIPDCLRKIEEYRPKLDVVVNFGVYVIEDRDMDVITMIDRAQAAKKGVKGGYLNRYAYYDNQLRKKEQRERDIVGRMRQALENEEFLVYLQPQYRHPSGKLVGAEALTRWNHPTRGLILPREFIPLFEENGFISELDRYVWQKVCILLRSWKEKALPIVPVSVNFSRVDLFDPQLLKTLEATMNAEGVRASMLGIEITESAFVEDSSHMSEVLRKFRNAGFTVYMDDFGTGYSSLNILKDIPVDVLKLDMRFLTLNRKNATKAHSILKSVIQMSSDLSVTTVAEGVENRKQADDLEKMGCNVVQGDLYSMPISADAYEELLKKLKKTKRKGKV